MSLGMILLNLTVFFRNKRTKFLDKGVRCIKIEYYKEFLKKLELLKLDCYKIWQGKSGFSFHIAQVLEPFRLCTKKMSYIDS